MNYQLFGREVKKKLVDIGQTQKWLIERVKERTGLYLDTSYMSRIMRGNCHPEKIIEAIKEILEL